MTSSPTPSPEREAMEEAAKAMRDDYNANRKVPIKPWGESGTEDMWRQHARAAIAAYTSSVLSHAGEKIREVRERHERIPDDEEPTHGEGGEAHADRAALLDILSALMAEPSEAMIEAAKWKLLERLGYGTPDADPRDDEAYECISGDDIKTMFLAMCAHAVKEK